MKKETIANVLTIFSAVCLVGEVGLFIAALIVGVKSDLGFKLFISVFVLLAVIILTNKIASSIDT
jgi:hypothetical protein